MKPLTLLAVASLAISSAVSLALAPTVASAAATPTRHAVAAYQRQLNRLGCDAGRPDGRMDHHTRSALVRIQTRTGLRTTGRLDRATKRTLRRAPKRCDHRPVPAGSGHGRRIVVSQRQDWVWLVRADGSVAAQAGTVDNPAILRKGTYATGSYCGRAARIRHNTDLSGTKWLDDFVRFAPCGIGFHRIPRHKSDGRQVHADWVLGTDFARSDGCIRVSRRMAERIWNFTAAGRTTVRVV